MGGNLTNCHVHISFLNKHLIAKLPPQFYLQVVHDQLVALSAWLTEVSVSEAHLISSVVLIALAVDAEKVVI